MREDVIKMIERQKDLTNIFVLTFNIDLLFLESILLRSLRRCGHPSLTVFADADEVARTFQSQSRWIRSIGRHYRVVPMEMEHGFRFHPKALLLSGEKRARLLVGSGNLTFGGMRQNDEIWTVFDSEEDGTGSIATFQEILASCINRIPQSQAVRSEVSTAMNTNTHPWAKGLDAPSDIIWRIGNRPSLLKQLDQSVGDHKVDRILIGSPYFDIHGAALNSIIDRWPGIPIEVLVQESHSNLTKETLKSLRKRVIFHQVNSGRSSSFIHAKFYAFVGPIETILFLGSANCSVAALSLGGTKGNGELLARIVVPTAEFQNEVLSEVTINEVEPELNTKPNDEIDQESKPKLRILQASLDNGILNVAYRTTGDATHLTVKVDDNRIEQKNVQILNSSIRVPISMQASRVCLEAIIDENKITSTAHWIDHEFILSATSHRRQIARAIGENIQPGQWTFKGWYEILRLVGKELSSGALNMPKQDREKNEDDKPKYAGRLVDVNIFTDDYRLPRSLHDLSMPNETDRVRGLQGLLLGYFGQNSESDSNVYEGFDEEEGRNEDDEEAVDQPEKIPTDHQNKGRKFTRSKIDLSATERRKGQRIAQSIINTLTDQSFLNHRPPALLATDITVTAVLLTSGIVEGWLDEDDFLDLTYRVWSFWFFDDGDESSTKSPPIGCLERLIRDADEPKRFISELSTVPLTAALAVWCSCRPFKAGFAESARFQVASKLAVARLPWLWNLDKKAEVVKELRRLVLETGWLRSSPDRNWNRLISIWDEMIGEGLAIRQFEKHFISAEFNVGNFSSSISDEIIPKGSLLWQGAKLGFCILGENANRITAPTRSYPLLTLRSSKRNTRISARYIIPFKSLITTLTNSGQIQLQPTALSSIYRFADRLELAFELPCEHELKRNILQ